MSNQVEFLQQEIFGKGWGREIVIINNEKFCGKILEYNKVGAVSSSHYHVLKDECFFCLRGSFVFYFWDEKGIKNWRILRPNDVVYIPKCTPHQLRCLEDNSAIVEFSTQHLDSDVVRIEPGDSQNGL